MDGEPRMPVLFVGHESGPLLNRDDVMRVLRRHSSVRLGEIEIRRGDGRAVWHVLPAELGSVRADCFTLNEWHYFATDGPELISDMILLFGRPEVIEKPGNPVDQEIVEEARLASDLARALGLGYVFSVNHDIDFIVVAGFGER